MRPSEVPKKHPNATLSGSIAAPAVVVVWVLGGLGVEMSQEQAATVMGLAITIGLLIGRRGVKGVWRLIMEGSDEHE